MRIGQGFDFHAWGKPAEFVTLGGISIPCEWSIKAHSDGDVVLHALCDALLGAAGLGDIGEHFPDTNADYKHLSSTIFVAGVLDLLSQQHWQVGNVDITIITEFPRLLHHRPAMRGSIADLLALEQNQVNIKATTMESLGCIGRGEGIAAMAVVLLVDKKNA